MRGARGGSRVRVALGAALLAAATTVTTPAGAQAGGAAYYAARGAPPERQDTTAGLRDAHQFLAMGRVPAVREPAPRAATTYAVVANANVPVSELTLDDLRSVFFFRKRFWSGGKRVVLLLPAERSEARGYLLEGIYRMNDAALKRLILEKLFQGEIDMAPRVVETNQEALALVASTRGLVTLVRADAITAGQAGVKVLKINGKLPGEAGYPLMQ